jgi:hypothetical protein
LIGDGLRGLRRCAEIHDQKTCDPVDMCHSGHHPAATPAGWNTYLLANGKYAGPGTRAVRCAGQRRRRPRRRRTTPRGGEAGRAIPVRRYARDYVLPVIGNRKLQELITETIPDGQDST